MPKNSWDQDQRSHVTGPLVPSENAQPMQIPQIGNPANLLVP